MRALWRLIISVVTVAADKSAGSDQEMPRALQVTSDGSRFVAGDTRGALEGFENRGERDVFVLATNRSGEELWHLQRGSNSHDYAYALTMDSAGDLILAGFTGGSLDGFANAGVDDAFVMKITRSGRWLWTHQRGTRYEDRISSAQVTASDEIVVAGHTKGQLDGNGNAGDADVFIMMLDSQGSWQWTQQRGSTRYDYVAAFELDTAGEYLLAGFTEGSLDGFANAGGDDLFVMKLSSAGWLWTQQRGTRYEDRATALQVSSADGIFLAGYTKGSLDGNSNQGDADVFLMRLDHAGQHLWTQQRGSSSFDSCSALQLLPGELLLVGHTQGTMAEQSMGMEDILVQSFDLNGSHLWTRQTGSYGSDRATAIALDENNEAIVVGYVGTSQLLSTLSALMEGEVAAGSALRAVPWWALVATAAVS